jgi:hypothetical protein
MEDVEYVVQDVVGTAKTVTVAAQRATIFAQRKDMTTRDYEWRMLRETYRHYERL